MFRGMIRLLSPWSSLILANLFDSCIGELSHKRDLHCERKVTDLNSLIYLCNSGKRQYMVEFMTVIHTLWKNGEFSKEPK